MLFPSRAREGAGPAMPPPHYFSAVALFPTPDPSRTREGRSLPWLPILP
ncbi:hypothetical protein GGQ62_000408 [Polymorphobacter fuscus]|nr:hypothetical protein [Polymorphobacter fuscus]